MIRVNKKHSVEYKNDYFIVYYHGTTEKGVDVIKKKQTYPDIGAMVLQCGFKMDYEYTDAAMQSKAEYELHWNKSHLSKLKKDKEKKLQS